MKNKIKRRHHFIALVSMTAVLWLSGLNATLAYDQVEVLGATAAHSMAAASGVVVERDAPPVARDRVKSDVELRAEALLAIAVQHIKNNGPQGAADFNDESVFVDRDLYVYALGMDGMMLGSGGWSRSLVGQSVLNETDTHGQYFFQKMIEMAREQDRGQIQYHWFNPAGPFDEPKVTDFVKQGDVIVAVGYYPPRATRRQAQQLLQRAIDTLAAQPNPAFDVFHDSDGEFISNDLYVFAVDVDNGLFVAHGASPSLVGSDAYALLDAMGRNVVLEMANMAQARGHGELDYFWINPMTGRIESKHTFFRLQDGYLVAVGSYN